MEDYHWWFSGKGFGLLLEIVLVSLPLLGFLAKLFNFNCSIVSSFSCKSLWIKQAAKLLSVLQFPKKITINLLLDHCPFSRNMDLLLNCDIWLTWGPKIEAVKHGVQICLKFYSYSTACSLRWLESCHSGLSITVSFVVTIQYITGHISRICLHINTAIEMYYKLPSGEIEKCSLYHVRLMVLHIYS